MQTTYYMMSWINHAATRKKVAAFFVYKISNNIVIYYYINDYITWLNTYFNFIRS